MDLSRKRRISIRYKDIVYGWMKQMQCLLPSDEPYFIINELIQDLCLLYFAHLIDTQILTDEEQTSLFDAVNKQLSHKCDAKWELLFRGSRDKFGRDNFYSKCDGKGSIICIIQSPQNNVFGGYQSVRCDKERADTGFPWTEEYEDDPFAFIYKIRSAAVEIFPVKNGGKKAIQHYLAGYLSFGYNGMAMYISADHDDVEATCFACGNSCTEYNLNRLQLNGEITRFYVKEIEVFQI